MRKTPYILVLLSLLLPLILAAANWINSQSGATRPFYLWVQARFSGIVFTVAIAAFLISGLKELPGLIAFRQDRIQQALDQWVKDHCKASAKQHRLTVFRKVLGLRAFLKGAWRLMWQYGGTKEKWRALRGIKLFRHYLCVYARAAEARNPLSAAAFRVSDARADCEGMAGLAWEQGFCVAYGLLPPRAAELQKVNGLSGLDPNHPVAVYAAKSNLNDIGQLRAIAHPARHFMGSVIRKGGKPWGVLLLDSESASSPFPDPGKKRDGGQFGKEFKAFAAFVSHFL